MLYGLYLSAQGADVQSLRQDVLANNIANASTTAFKRDHALIQGHPTFDLRKGLVKDDDAQRNRSTGGVSLARIATNFATGSHERSGRPFDVALSGPGFMRVRSGDEELLTRNGRLTRSEIGELVMEDTGLPILSTAGAAIEIPDNVQRITIDDRGNLLGFDANGVPAYSNALDIVGTETQKLEKLGQSLYRAHGPVEPSFETHVRQGYIESSGVSPIKEMTGMIESSRTFEANINMIRMQDESLGRLLQSVGG